MCAKQLLGAIESKRDVLGEIRPIQTMEYYAAVKMNKVLLTLVTIEGLMDEINLFA